MKHPQVCVIGVGRFGRALAVELARRGCRVSVMDKDKQAIEPIAGIVDFSCVGDASDGSALRELRLERFEKIYLALGKDVMPSLAVASVLGEAARAKLVCRISGEPHRFALQQIGVEQTRDIEAIAAAAIADEEMGGPSQP